MKKRLLRNWLEVCCNLSRLLVRKITKRIHSSKPASLNCPIVTTALVCFKASIVTAALVCFRQSLYIVTTALVCFRQSLFAVTVAMVCFRQSLSAVTAVMVCFRQSLSAVTAVLVCFRQILCTVQSLPWLVSDKAYLQYSLEEDGSVDLWTTEVPPAHRNKGVAKLLAQVSQQTPHEWTILNL